MLRIDKKEIIEKIFDCKIGLERETLRIDKKGCLAKTPHQFPKEECHIVRDFSEGQVEINTPPCDSVTEVMESLAYYDGIVRDCVSKLDEPEYIWPFSNPPYIRNEDDILIAQFNGEDSEKTIYREHLAERYGKYKMMFSGIHYNYSFSEELLSLNYQLAIEEDEINTYRDFQDYKDKFYLHLAEQCAIFGWLITSVTAASPLMDGSYMDKKALNQDLFLGLASVRCSELGYWNAFSPVFSYENITSYADSIQSYVDKGYLAAPSELYYPIRLKPRGINNLETLREKGVDHIEIRTIDLNPFSEYGIDERDASFIQLLLVYLSSLPRHKLDEMGQIQAVQNFKNASRYDLKIVKIVFPDGKVVPAADAALKIIEDMEQFYNDIEIEVKDVLTFQKEKFQVMGNRYACQVYETYKDGFVKKGLELAKSTRGENDKKGAQVSPLCKAIYNKYIRPIKRPRTPACGLEFELPIVNLDKQAVDFDVIHEVTDHFIEKFHFDVVHRDEEGYIFSTINSKNGDNLSYDCSYNTLEFSFGKEENLNIIYQRFVEYYTFVQDGLKKSHHMLTGMGINPYREYNLMKPIQNGRYRMLLHHLKSYEKYGDIIPFHHVPDFGLFSAASQVQLDVEESEVVDALNVFSKLEPLKALILANSPYEDKLCARDYFWKYSMHGVNPHNVDTYETKLHSIAELQAYIKSMSIYCLERDGKYINFAPIPLEKYFASKTIIGEYYDSEQEKYVEIEFNPSFEDLGYLRSFKFSDLTYRGTIEFRSVCEQPVSEIMASAALHAGLMEKIPELSRLLDTQQEIYEQGYTLSELRAMFVKKELPEFLNKEKTSELLKEILDLAYVGLVKRGFNEEEFIRPLYRRAKLLLSPAREMMEGITSGMTLDDYIRKYAELAAS